MKFRVLPDAQQDIAGIDDWVTGQFGPSFAVMTLAQLYDTFDLLAAFPHMGHARPDVEARHVLFFLLKPYWMVYKPGEPLLIQAIGAPLTGLEPNALLNGEHHFRFGTRGEHIDILALIGEMTFDDVWHEWIDVDVAGLAVPFISKKRLMQNKRQTGRHRDLVDVEDLKLLPDAGEDGFIC